MGSVAPAGPPNEGVSRRVGARELESPRGIADVSTQSEQPVTKHLVVGENVQFRHVPTAQPGGIS
jgi:hypothetical protein